MSSRPSDLTKEFRTYREAVRLIWNTFLKDCADPELDFPDIDHALFGAIIEARVNADLAKQTVGEYSFLPDLEVKSQEKEIIRLTRQTDSILWARAPRPPVVQLRYVGLFDFDWTAANRDFEFLQCIIVKREGPRTVAVSGDNMLLVLARTAKIKFVAPE